MIEEDLIQYETAVLAKSKGFSNIKTIVDKIQHEYVDSGGNGTGDYYYKYQEVIKEIIPTQTVLAKWLRVNHNIHITIGCSEIQKYNLIVETAHDGGTTLNSPLWKLYDSYEQALEAGLQHALNLI